MENNEDKKLKVEEGEMARIIKTENRQGEDFFAGIESGRDKDQFGLDPQAVNWGQD